MLRKDTPTLTVLIVMSLQVYNQGLFTLQCLLSTSHGYPVSSLQKFWDRQQSHIFLVLTQCPPVSSFISTCKQREIQGRHKQSAKVNCFFGNQFPFRNQVQTALAWAVKKDMYWKGWPRSSDLKSSHRIF